MTTWKNCVCADKHLKALYLWLKIVDHENENKPLVSPCLLAPHERVVLILTNQKFTQFSYEQ